MSTLATLQSMLQYRILHDGPVPRVQGANAGARLRIYADAWRLRLVEVLGNDFHATRDALGEAVFSALADTYLHAHPSTRPSVRHLGHAFADWLATQDGVPQGLHELARFEWLQAAAFDAADTPMLGTDAIAALAPEAWPGLHLHLQASLQLLQTTHVAANGSAPAYEPGHAPAQWLLWRDAGGDVLWRQLEDDEAQALHAVSIGASFGELCERLTEHHGDDSALRAASLLKRWLADGLLAAENAAD